MAQYDLPAFVNYAKEVTGAPSVGYVGHSQGTTQAVSYDSRPGQSPPSHTHIPRRRRASYHPYAHTTQQFAAFSPANDRASLASSVNLFVALAPVADTGNNASSNRPSQLSAAMKGDSEAVRVVLRKYAEKYEICDDRMEERDDSGAAPRASPSQTHGHDFFRCYRRRHRHYHRNASTRACMAANDLRRDARHTLLPLRRPSGALPYYLQRRCVTRRHRDTCE